MKVYFLKEITKFSELGNVSQSLIPDGNSCFEECNEVEKKVTFDDEVEAMLNKYVLLEQSLRDRSVNKSTQHATTVECGIKSLFKVQEARIKFTHKAF